MGFRALGIGVWKSAFSPGIICSRDCLEEIQRERLFGGGGGEGENFFPRSVYWVGFIPRLPLFFSVVVFFLLRIFCPVFIVELFMGMRFKCSPPILIPSKQRDKESHVLICNLLHQVHHWTPPHWLESRDVEKRQKIWFLLVFLQIPSCMSAKPNSAEASDSAFSLVEEERRSEEGLKRTKAECIGYT